MERQHNERKQETDDIERRKQEVNKQIQEDRARTREIEERKNNRAQQDEDRRKTERIEEMKRKQGSS